MTDREYTIRAAQLKDLSLIKPTKGSPGILAYNFKSKDASGMFPCVIDAKTWTEARAQIAKFYDS